MVKSIYVAAISLLTVVILAGCRTPDPAHAPTGGNVEFVELGGTLKLTDGTPVPGANITVRCGSMTKSTTTANDGTFSAGTVPGGPCTLSSAKAHVEKSIRISKSLLGDKPRVSLEVPDKTRVVLSGFGRRWVIDTPLVTWAVAPGGPTKALFAIRVKNGTATLTKLGCSTCKPRPVELRPGVKLPVSQTNKKIDYLVVEEVQRVAKMPLALRGPARIGAVFNLHLKTLGHQPTKLPVADRQLILLMKCESKPELLEELNHLAATYRSTGLNVAVLQTGLCTHSPSNIVWLHGRGEPANTSYRHYYAPEACWALGANSGEIVILERDGKVVFRQRADKASAIGTTAFDDAVSFLDRTWPALAARRRISVTKAASVKTAETVRLTEQVDVQLKANRFPEAHRLLDRLVQLSPELAEARKLRALVRARLGDYTGAMQEVAWWRTSFGSESAEELEDQVKQASKGRLGALR